jgi:nitroreductase
MPQGMTDLDTSPLGIIFGRRSIRRYQTRTVEPEKVDAVLRAGMAAPSAVAKDPWRFVVVQDRAVLKRLSQGLKNGSFLADAPLGIIVCGELAAAHDQQESYLLQDCSAAIENILLAAHALGLGACWLGVHPRAARIAYLREVLGIPEAITPISGIAIGYPAETKEARTRYDPGRVHYDKW